MSLTPEKHCPFCNDTAVNGQGAAWINGSTLVQYRCQGCGELFFGADKRHASTASAGKPATGSG